jgi:hypothetical protein
MNLGELRAQFRDMADDEAQPYLWADTVVNDRLNAAEVEAAERAFLLEDSEGPATPVTLTSLTQSAGTAVATKNGHGFADGEVILLAGADQTAYNTVTRVIVPNINTFTFKVPSATVSPATGTITAVLASAAILNMTVQDGLAKYPLHSSIIRLRDVSLDGRFLTGKSREWLNETFPRGWEQLSGDPQHFLDPQQKFLQLVRKPVAGAALRLFVYRRPLVPMINDSDSPEIPAHLHRLLPDWAAYLSYSKRDSETYDEKRAMDHLARFTANFGERPSADVRRKQEARREHQVRMNPQW